MSTSSLPDRPDMEQLRRQAKELCDSARHGEQAALERFTRHLPGRDDPVTLAQAQLVVAREHGFASWPQLKAAIDAMGGALTGRLSEFLTASVESNGEGAIGLFAADPSIERGNVYVSAVLGDVEHMDELLRTNPAIGLAVDDERGWPPLLYACYSYWHRLDPARAPGLVGVAQLLLDAGASPNTHNGHAPNRPGYRSALHGAVTRNNPGVARQLLEGGAGTDDRVSLRAAVLWPDHACLRLLLDHGASMERTWALETAVSEGDAAAVAMLLDAAGRRASPGQVADMANGQMAHAAQHGSAPVVETLLARGAGPDGEGGQEPPLREAVRSGHAEVADLLVSRGALDNLTDVDRFVGACARADRAEAEHLLATRAGLWDRLTDADRATLVDAAAGPSTAPVALMLDLGFSPATRNDNGETALHSSAYQGRAGTVTLLLAHGAEVDARDTQFDGTPLGFATVGSGERPNSDGDWALTVRLLLDAGASRENVWLSGPKAPSNEVVEVLRAYGATPDSPPAPGPVTEHVPNLDRTYEVATRLREAYEAADLEVFASLLHPDVHWGGGPWGCTNREEVIGWYKDQRDRGFRAHITTIELAGNTIIAGLAFGRPPEGARDGAPDMAYQLLDVNEGSIVRISGFSDLDAARAAANRPGAT